MIRQGLVDCADRESTRFDNGLLEKACIKSVLSVNMWRLVPVSKPSSAANRKRVTVVRALSLCNSLALYVLTVLSLFEVLGRFLSIHTLPRSERTSVSRLDKTGAARCL